MSHISSRSDDTAFFDARFSDANSCLLELRDFTIHGTGFRLVNDIRSDRKCLACCKNDKLKIERDLSKVRNRAKCEPNYNVSHSLPENFSL